MKIFSPRVFREVWRLAWPVVVSMFSITGIMVADTVMVGQLGKIPLAAAGLGGMAYWTFSSLFIGASYSVQILTARRFGQKNYKEISEIFFHSLVLFVFISLVSTWALLHYSVEILDVLSNDPQVIFLGGEYLWYRSLGTIPFFLAFQFRSFYDGLGKTEVGMVASFLMAVSNIFLNYVLIYGNLSFPAMGVKGAGAASSLAAGISLMYYVWVLTRDRKESYLRVHGIRFRWDVLREIVRLGWPPSLAEFGQNLGFFAFMTLTSLLPGGSATASAAAGNILFSVTSIAFMPGIAFSVAATTITGQSLGAGKQKKAILGALHSFFGGGFIMAFMGVVFIVFATEILLAYTPDTEVMQTAFWPLILVSVFQMFDASNMIFAGALRGAGLVNWVMYRTLFVTWIIMLPVAWFFGIFMQWNTFGLWTGTVTWMFSLAVLNFRKFYKKEWIYNKI